MEKMHPKILTRRPNFLTHGIKSHDGFSSTPPSVARECYASHEKETFEAVVSARAKATQMNIDPSNCTPEQLKQYQEAQGELGAALGRLIAIQENYPELKANENFRDLQVQLEGTENRINEARNKFNEKVTDYNKRRRVFPTNLIAGLFNFEDMPKFEADASAQNAPKVKF